MNRNKPATGCSGNGDSLVFYNTPLGYGMGDPHLWADNNARWSVPALPDPVTFPNDRRAVDINHVTSGLAFTGAGAALVLALVGAIALVAGFAALAARRRRRA